MVVIRYLAHAALMSTLVAGCSQSLFDANPGNGGSDGGAPPDARRSDGSVDGPPDGGGDVGPKPDAGVQTRCPAPCVGDAVAEFNVEQDGMWRYTESLLDADGLPQFLDMIYANYSVLSAWIGATTPFAAIASCPAHAGTSPPDCAGVEQKLLFVPTNNTPGARQPALLWSVPKTGAFRLTADWRIADGTTAGGPSSVLVARNGLFDSLYTAAFDNSTTPRAFDFEADAVAGDTFALTVIPGDNTNIPLGVSFYITDLERNDACQMAFGFAGEPPFDNRCDNGDVIGEAGATPTLSAAPPPGVPGEARVFVDDSSLQHQGGYNTYSGDWTLQFWAALEGPGDILSDRACRNLGRPESGGVDITFDGDTVLVRIGEEISGNDYCVPNAFLGVTGLSSAVDFENAADWHFYRVVRNKQAGTVTACVDGKQGSEPPIAVPAAATMATDRNMEIGRPADISDGSFEGKIADLRMYSRALPCTPPPAR